MITPICLATSALCSQHSLSSRVASSLLSGSTGSFDASSWLSTINPSLVTMIAGGLAMLFLIARIVRAVRTLRGRRDRD